MTNAKDLLSWHDVVTRTPPMTNKTYTLKDGTVLKVGDVYEATPEGYLRMVAHHVEMFGHTLSPLYNPWLELVDSKDLCREPRSLAYNEAYRIIWLPEQADDNVIPPDEVVEWARQGRIMFFISPATNTWCRRENMLSGFSYTDMHQLEWLIAKGVTFYKNKPEGA